MKVIPLTQGNQMLVDDEDYDRLSWTNWGVKKKDKKKNPYAMSTRKLNGRRIMAHRMIMNAKTGEDVDHINGNTLDNRRCNMRKCTRADNARNRGPNKNNTSGFKGVYRTKDNKKWSAMITVNYSSKWLGTFNDKLEAAHAYNKAALREFGSFAWINRLEGNDE